MYGSGLHILAQLIAFFSFPPLRLLRQRFFFFPPPPLADSEETHPHTQNNSSRDISLANLKGGRTSMYQESTEIL